MPERISRTLENVQHLRRAHTWVGSESGSDEVPDPNKAKFLISCSRTGRYGLAVRGFLGGEPLDANYDASGILQVEINSVAYSLQEAMSGRLVTKPLPRGVVGAYLRALKEPEEPTNPEDVQSTLLARVLQQRIPGVWDIGRDSEDVAWGRVIIDEKGRVGVHPYDRECKWNPAKQGFGEVGPDVYPGEVLQDGPVIKLEFGNDGIRRIACHTLADRITGLRRAERQDWQRPEEFAALGNAYASIEAP